MAVFRLYDNNIIYLYHWLTPKQPLKISTGIKIDPEKWDKENRKPKSPKYTYQDKSISRELTRIEKAFNDAMMYFETNGGVSPIKLRQKYNEFLSGETSGVNSIGVSKFLEFFEEATKEYQVKDINNWKGYKTTLNHLKVFYGREVPTFEDIDMSFYVRYNNYLVDQDLSTNSVSNHWKFIKAILRKAQNLGLHKNTAYRNFTQIREKSDTIFLTEEELQRMFDLELKGYLEKARDYFLIGGYTGLRYEDWDQLNLSIIKNGMAEIISNKTGIKAHILVRPNVIRILSKYQDGKLPSKPSNQKMNLYIKEVARLTGIDDLISKRITKGSKKIITTSPKYKLVTTHTARRSFASIMVLKGVPTHIIMKMTGHNSHSSFESYVRFNELQATLQIKDSEIIQQTFGKELTFSEKLQHDPEFKKQQLLHLL